VLDPRRQHSQPANFIQPSTIVIQPSRVNLVGGLFLALDGALEDEGVLVLQHYRGAIAAHLHRADIARGYADGCRAGVHHTRQLAADEHGPVLAVSVPAVLDGDRPGLGLGQ
jgi:hypothetical protein